jgi:large subunit ribosomal protein L24
LTVAVRSTPGSDARIDARLNAGGLAASANGSARLFAAGGLATALDVTLQAADASPVRRGSSPPGVLLPVALRAKLNASPSELSLDGLSGAVGGGAVRGNLKLATDSRRIAGQIDADAIDVPALLAIFAGMPRVTARDGAPMWASEPFGESMFSDLTGRVEVIASRVALTPALTARQLRGTLRIEPAEIAFEKIEGVLAGGRASGQLSLRRGTEGLGMRARVSLAGGDAAALLPGEGKAPLTGRVGLQADIEGAGLSPASLIGSLRGVGTITLEDAQIASLDPKAFNAAIRAAEQSVAIDAPRIRDIITTVLDGGRLAVPRLDAAVTINAGQASMGQTTWLGQGADVAISGSADLADASIDARLTLTGPTIHDGMNSIRPEILVTLKGPYSAPKRAIDVSALSGWLTLRSVERQAKQISAIEAERREFERREAERREADTREAERQEVERKAAESKPSASSIPAALPVPQIMEEPSSTEPPARAARPPRPRQPAAEQAPTLPPPLNIGPPPGATKPAPPLRSGAAAQNPPPPPPRSALDVLFGVQR